MSVIQAYEIWMQRNPNGTWLQYLKEQLQTVNFCLYYPSVANSLSKEEVFNLKKEEEWFSAKIHEVEWAIKTCEIMQWK